MRRSMLFVPSIREDYLRNAENLKADSVILDLEDSVAEGWKEGARKKPVEALRRKRYKQEVIVRINKPGTREFRKDMKAVLGEGVRKIMIPKVEGAGDVRKVKGVKAGIEVFPIIETIKGFVNAGKIIKSAKGSECIIFGAEDFCSEFNIKRGKVQENPVLQKALVDLAVLAKANGMELIDCVYPYFRTKKDLENLRKEAEFTRELGCSGKLLIHPNQIETVNMVYVVKEKEKKEARERLERFEESFKEGMSVTTHKGRMIDVPEYKRSQRLLNE